MAQAIKTALITGAARRIGRTIALDLAGHGYAIALHYKASRDEAEALCDEIITQGGKAIALGADLSELDSAARLMDACHEAFGGIDVLVNNASIFDSDGAADFDWETWERHFAVHLRTPVALTRAMAERMEPDREGLVVNVIDQRVWRLTPRFFTYTLSKSALWTATQTMAQAFAPRLRVNAIGPGPSLPNERQSDADFERQRQALLLERGPELSEFGATVRYLHENRSITGQMIALDGGQHLAWETPDVAGVTE